MKFLIFLLVAKISLSFGLEFECAYQFSQKYAVIGSVYKCKTSNPTFGIADPILYKVSGNPLTGFTHRSVEMVEIENAADLTYIPQDMSNTGLFPSLIALKMSGTGLQHLKAAQLNDYRNLMWLSLSNNQIVNVPDDFFRFTPNLRFIDFNSNNIETVGFDLLTPLNIETLQYAGFKNNTCIDREYMPLEETNYFSFLYDLQYDCQPVYTTTLAPSTTTSSTTEYIETTPSHPTEEPTPPVISTVPTPSTTAAPPTCSGVEVGEEVCKLHQEIRNLALVIEKRDQVFRKYEDVLIYIQEVLRNIVVLLNKNPNPVGNL